MKRETYTPSRFPCLSPRLLRYPHGPPRNGSLSEKNFFSKDAARSTPCCQIPKAATTKKIGTDTTSVNNETDKISFNDLTKSRSRILDDRYAPVKSSNVKITGMIDISISGDRVSSIRSLNGGMVVIAARVTNPNVRFNSTEMNAVRKPTLSSFAAAKSDRTKTGTTMAETIV